MTKRSKGGGYPSKQGGNFASTGNSNFKKNQSESSKTTGESNASNSDPVKFYSTIKIDYSKSGKDLVVAGKFDHVGPEIAMAVDQCTQVWSDTLVMTLEYPLETKLSSPTNVTYKSMHTAEVLALLDDRGLRPATLREGLEFAKANPSAQKKHPIAILGTIGKIPPKSGEKFVGFLFNWLRAPDQKRGLYFIPVAGRWSSNTVFLATKKINEISVDETIE